MSEQLVKALRGNAKGCEKISKTFKESRRTECGRRRRRMNESKMSAESPKRNHRMKRKEENKKNKNKKMNRWMKALIYSTEVFRWSWEGYSSLILRVYPLKHQTGPDRIGSIGRFQNWNVDILMNNQSLEVSLESFWTGVLSRGFIRAGRSFKSLEIVKAETWQLIGERRGSAELIKDVGSSNGDLRGVVTW